MKINKTETGLCLRRGRSWRAAGVTLGTGKSQGKTTIKRNSVSFSSFFFLSKFMSDQCLTFYMGVPREQGVSFSFRETGVTRSPRSDIDIFEHIKKTFIVELISLGFFGYIFH